MQPTCPGTEALERVLWLNFSYFMWISLIIQNQRPIPKPVELRLYNRGLASLGTACMLSFVRNPVDHPALII